MLISDKVNIVYDSNLECIKTWSFYFPSFLVITNGNCMYKMSDEFIVGVACGWWSGCIRTHQ